MMAGETVTARAAAWPPPAISLSGPTLSIVAELWTDDGCAPAWRVAVFDVAQGEDAPPATEVWSTVSAVNAADGAVAALELPSGAAAWIRATVDGWRLHPAEDITP